ncbi:sulfite exporter TauE/SafE family protein [Parvularcula oceani]|uniref:sulfite exporter TauE/SafE family protein n=1 Tax=Parvularcula oceani TaxID=1247963 RepID=UPI0004E13416|nr:sulfite exporter TauE/SafE family protein [Parvularcula oceani]
MPGLDPSALLAAVFSGVLVGWLLGTFGGGGSVLAAPLLLYAVGVDDTHLAIGTSAAGVAAIAAFNLLGHWRGGRVKWPCAWVFGAAGFAGSLLGSSIAKLMDGDVLLLAFAGAMAAVALSMLRRGGSGGDPEARLDAGKMARLVPVGLVVGTASGFFGIGGGFLIVPGLMYAAGLTFSHAAAASLLSVMIFGTATSANYALSGYVDLRLTGALLLGGALGGLLGIRTARRLENRRDLGRRLFAALVLAVAAVIAWDAVGRI